MNQVLTFRFLGENLFAYRIPQFGAVALILLGLWSPAGRRWKVMAGLLAGGLIPAFLVVWFWSDDLPGAVEQFRWATRFQIRGRSNNNTAKLVTVLRWSRFWWIGLVTVVTVLFLPFIPIPRPFEATVDHGGNR